MARESLRNESDPLTVFRFGDDGRMYVLGQEVVLVDALLNNQAVGRITRSLMHLTGRMVWDADVREALEAELAAQVHEPNSCAGDPAGDGRRASAVDRDEAADA